MENDVIRMPLTVKARKIAYYIREKDNLSTTISMELLIHIFPQKSNLLTLLFLFTFNAFHFASQYLF